jgi:hypothetical protein
MNSKKISKKKNKTTSDGQFEQYLEFIHVIELRGGQSKNFW